jgi:hypothetical protein
MYAAFRFGLCVFAVYTAILLSGCQPSRAQREQELRTFVQSLVDGTSTWEQYVSADKRRSALDAKSAITADFQVLDWDYASVWRGFGDDLYEYRLRFSNGREAVSYVSVEKGRITQITLDLYDAAAP